MALFPQVVWGINVSHLLREELPTSKAAEKTAQLAGLMRAIECGDVYEYLETLGEDVFDNGELTKNGENILEKFDDGLNNKGFVLSFFKDLLAPYFPYLNDKMLMEFHYIPGDASLHEYDVEPEDVILGLELFHFPLTSEKLIQLPHKFRNEAAWFSWVIGV